MLPELTDNVYRSIPFLFRLIAAKKRLVQGGTQIEVPLMYARFSNGGPYRGYDQLTITPQDTVKNAAYDWKQQSVGMAIDGLTLIKANSPEAIANIIRLQADQAQMEMAENLATGIYSDAVTDAKQIDGLKGAVDDGTVATTYAGLLRSSNTWWKSKMDTTSATLTLSVLQSMFGNTTEGGRAPTVILSRQEQYNRYWALNVINQNFPVQPAGHDEQLASAGFTNGMFNNVPWLIDSHVFDGPNSSNSAILMLNEDFFYWVVAERGDFAMEDWVKPSDQDAYSTHMLWAGNLVLTNDARQGKLTNISA